MRKSLFIMVVAFVLSALGGAALAQRLLSYDPPNTDRRGLDYQRIVTPGKGSAYCAQLCRADARCAAFTYVRPGYQEPAAVCYLKHAVPAMETNKCCESGTVGRVAVPPVHRNPPIAALGADGRPLGDRGGIAGCKLSGALCPPRMQMAIDENVGCICQERR